MESWSPTTEEIIRPYITGNVVFALETCIYINAIGAEEYSSKLSSGWKWIIPNEITDISCAELLSPYEAHKHFFISWRPSLVTSAPQTVINLVSYFLGEGPKPLEFPLGLLEKIKTMEQGQLGFIPMIILDEHASNHSQILIVSRLCEDELTGYIVEPHGFGNIAEYFKPDYLLKALRKAIIKYLPFKKKNSEETCDLRLSVMSKSLSGEIQIFHEQQIANKNKSMTAQEDANVLFPEGTCTTSCVPVAINFMKELLSKVTSGKQSRANCGGEKSLMYKMYKIMNNILGASCNMGPETQDCATVATVVATDTDIIKLNKEVDLFFIAMASANKFDRAATLSFNKSKLKKALAMFNPTELGDNPTEIIKKIITIRQLQLYLIMHTIVKDHLKQIVGNIWAGVLPKTLGEFEVGAVVRERDVNVQDIISTMNSYITDPANDIIYTSEDITNLISEFKESEEFERSVAKKARGAGAAPSLVDAATTASPAAHHHPPAVAARPSATVSIQTLNNAIKAWTELQASLKKQDVYIYDNVNNSDIIQTYSNEAIVIELGAAITGITLKAIDVNPAAANFAMLLNAIDQKEATNLDQALMRAENAIISTNKGKSKRLAADLAGGGLSKRRKSRTRKSYIFKKTKTKKNTRIRAKTKRRYKKRTRLYNSNRNRLRWKSKGFRSNKLNYKKRTSFSNKH